MSREGVKEEEEEEEVQSLRALFERGATETDDRSTGPGGCGWRREGARMARSSLDTEDLFALL